jgi:hypothetical protein
MFGAKHMLAKQLSVLCSLYLIKNIYGKGSYLLTMYTNQIEKLEEINIQRG